LLTTPRIVGANNQAKSKFIEILFDRTEWLDGTIFEADDAPIDIGSRTRSYSSYNFGNLPFSSGIKANHYPAVAQQGQLQNYYTKHKWAMMTATDGHGIDSVTKVWADTLREARQMVAEGANPDDITGTFPPVAALFDKNEYENAPMISKWAVQFIYSARRQDYDFTSMAALWVLWVVMKWQINPTPETYAVSTPIYAHLILVSQLVCCMGVLICIAKKWQLTDYHRRKCLIGLDQPNFKSSSLILTCWTAYHGRSSETTSYSVQKCSTAGYNGLQRVLHACKRIGMERSRKHYVLTKPQEGDGSQQKPR
jgi:hypothetical protein